MKTGKKNNSFYKALKFRHRYLTFCDLEVILSVKVLVISFLGCLTLYSPKYLE